MFHYNAKPYALMRDATGSIFATVGTKMILYYSFPCVIKIETTNHEPAFKYLPILTMSC